MSVPAHDASSGMASPRRLSPRTPGAVQRDEARALFGQAMGLVAVTVGCMALGAYLGRDLSGGAGIAFFVGSFVCIFALSAASAGGNDLLATGFLLGLGLLIGLGLGPVVNVYAQADPAAVWQAASATGAFVAILGAAGYATRRDLSSWSRSLFWGLIALLIFGVVAVFVSIPEANLIWSVAGLVIFGAWTTFDFNRLRRAGSDEVVPIAASIFLDVLNIFLFMLELFGSEQS